MLIVLIPAFSFSQTKIEVEKWGELKAKPVWLYTVTNSSGAQLKVTNYGAIITSVIVPDKSGLLEDVVLGFDNLEQYTTPNPCFGAAIGRFANRIKNGCFSIDGVEYQLEKNDGEHCIHGAGEFDHVVWDSRITRQGNGIVLNYLSLDGSKGFPGDLNVQITYTFTEDNEICVEYEATTNKATYVNLTQHSYFNLNACKDLIHDHFIKIDADNYTEIDNDIVPTGVISTVKGQLWDLTSLTRMGDNMKKMKYNGYHFNYIFNKKASEFEKVIEIYEPESGRTLEVSTSQPGVQFYSGNSISNTLVGKNGIKYGPHAAFCLETQHFPDSPNHPNFPSTLLRPGEKYKEKVVFKFGVQKM